MQVGAGKGLSELSVTRTEREPTSRKAGGHGTASPPPPGGWPGAGGAGGRLQLQVQVAVETQPAGSPDSVSADIPSVSRSRLNPRDAMQGSYRSPRGGRRKAALSRASTYTCGLDSPPGRDAEWLPDRAF